MPRTTKYQIQEQVDRLEEMLVHYYVKLSVDYTHEKPRLFFHGDNEIHECSPRLSKGDLRMWMDGFEKALKIMSGNYD